MYQTNINNHQLNHNSRQLSINNRQKGSSVPIVFKGFRKL